LKEPKSLIGQVALSIPFMIVNLLIMGLITNIFTQSSITLFQISGDIQNAYDLFKYILIPFLMVLVAGIIMMVIHELIHLLFIPNFTKSDNTYLSLMSLGECVQTKEPLPKYKVCLMHIAPFVVISVIFNAILGELGLYTIQLLMMLIFLNSLGSCADTLKTVLILLQVPKSAKIVNNGIQTYFRVDPKPQNYVH
jgi:hypothetical protein